MSAAILSGGATTTTTIISRSWKPPHLRYNNNILGVQSLSLKFLCPANSCYYTSYNKYRATITTAVRRSSIIMAASNNRVRAEDGDGRFRSLEQEGFISGFSNFGPNQFETTLNHLSKFLVTALFGVLLLWRHDPEALWAAAGSVINAGLSKVLKRMLNQERPVPNLRSEPGMPSSHAQSISYAVMFAILSLVQRLGLNGFTAVLSGLFIALGSYFSWLRVSQQLHTINQVIVGALLGTSLSILWFWSWESIVQKAFTSYIWVRIIVVMGGAVFCVGFFLYALRYWVMENSNFIRV